MYENLETPFVTKGQTTKISKVVPLGPHDQQTLRKQMPGKFIANRIFLRAG